MGRQTALRQTAVVESNVVEIVGAAIQCVDSFSELFADLIRQMLEREPSKRPTALEALEHRRSAPELELQAPGGSLGAAAARVDA